MRVTRSAVLLAATSGLAALVALGGVSCKGDANIESNSYYDRTIGPVLRNSCSRQTTGCHVANAHGDAVGNLDTTTFEMIDRRHDLLVTYGPYSAPGILMKVSGPQKLTVSTLDGPIEITTDIRHAAGAGIDITSEGYATLRRWMDGGATKDNVGATSGTHVTPNGECMKVIPPDPAFAAYDPGPTFDTFKSKVQPVLKACSAASCHGNVVADLSLTCGDSEEQLKWNHFIASQFVSATPESSELLRRPLDPARGGVFHEGGIVFSSSDEASYKDLLAWAKDRGGASVSLSDDGFKFFANRVQPMMVRKGCMFLGCHSPSMFHDLRLRGGSGGQFSMVATRRNYDMSRLMLSVESPDPNVSRLIAKNLYPFDRDIDPQAMGSRHRGGALLDDVPDVDHANLAALTNPKACGAFNLDTDDLSKIPAYCIFAEWHKRERDSALKKGPSAGGVATVPLSGIVYVERPPFIDLPQQFDTYRPGATLHVRAATMAADGTVSLTGDTDVTTGCGLSAATADIRGPAVSWDGLTIAFAARASADQPLAIYTMKADGTACAKNKLSEHDPKKNNIFIHDFDPTFAPDGRIVFASTRGAIGLSDVAYSGPTLTPSLLLPNSNLYVDDGDKIRQLTYLNNDELAPYFMKDGRVIFTTEKRAPGFYQLAGRRINLDGGDYHPFYAQRKSIGFEQLTEVRELADRNFVGVFSDFNATKGGAGTLGVVNRSLGPDQNDRDPADRFYLHSLTFPDATSTGKPSGGGGVYRSPAPLPTHGFLASYAAGVDTASFTGEFELVQIDTHTGVRTPLAKTAGKAILEAEAIYARASYGIFTSRPDEVNGSVSFEPGASDAQVTFMDAPMLATLLFTNTRIGRPIDQALISLGILESLPPDPDVTSPDKIPDAFAWKGDPYGTMWIKRLRLGVAHLETDGSLALRIPGGMPLVLELYDGDKLVGTQREEMGFGVGERTKQGFRRDFFDSQCAGCHGSVSGKEFDIHLNPDVLTSASRVAAISGNKLTDFAFKADKRGPVVPLDPALGK